MVSNCHKICVYVYVLYRISLRKSPNDAFSGNFGHDEYELPRIYVTLKLSDGKGFEV